MPVKHDPEGTDDRPEVQRLTLIGSEEWANVDVPYGSRVSRQLFYHSGLIVLTLDELHAELRMHRARIARQLPIVVELCATLDAGNQVAPEACDSMLAALQPLTATVHQLCCLIDETARLPLVAIPLRYDLVVIAHKLAEQLDESSHVITKLQRCRRATSKTTVRRLAEAQRTLEAVERSSGQVAQACLYLIDRTKLRHYLFAS